MRRLAPLVIKEKYSKERDHVQLQQLYDSMLKTPGERRVISFDVLVDSIKQGVKQGLFGLGELQEDRHKVRETGNDISRFNSVSFNHDTVESIEIGSAASAILIITIALIQFARARTVLPF